MTTEKQLTKRITDYLKSIPGLWWYKVHGGPYGRPGVPDIIVCYRGRFFAFEIKTAKGKPTKLQSHELSEINRAGGYAVVARDLDTVIEALNCEVR